jgi:hypothetical protein
MLLALAALWALAAPAGDPIVYRVEADGQGQRLTIEARFPAGTPAALAVDRGAEPFVAQVALVDGAPLARGGRTWLLDGCRSGCRVRYQFALAEAARALDDVDLAAMKAGTLIAPTSTWLLRPIDPRPRTAFRLTVTTPAGWAFVSGLRRAADGSYQGLVPDGFLAPYAAFGAFHNRRLDWPSGSIEVALAGDRAPRAMNAVSQWLRSAGSAIVAYYGRFPVGRLPIVVLPSGARMSGKTMGSGGATILLAPGDDPAADADDWVAAHELVHVATPDLPRTHLWLTEGLATYVEPIARARTGELSAEKIWTDLLIGLPKGLRHEQDRGLDGTHDWGRLYWGGALFCLLADVEIRQQTGNRLGLEHALRAVLAAGGTIEEEWPIGRFLDEADRPLPRPVLRPLYERMGQRASPVDLGALWKQLGVAARPGGGVLFDDRAPLAAVRRAITARAP